MTSPYTITPTPPTAHKLAPGEEGKFSFTLTSLEAPDRVQEVILQALLIGPDEKGKEVDWLKAGPPNTLTIAGGKTETVTITARPTAATPKGEHAIKLAIADKAHPNDTYVYSAPVTCEVADKGQVKPPTPLPKWLIPAIIGGVVVLGAGVFLVLKLTSGGGGHKLPGVGEPCASGATACEQGLICTPDSHICLLPGGGACEKASECLSGECLTKLGICSVPLGAACNPGERDLIPCLTQTSCEPTKKICMGSVGAHCTADAQCETGKCTNGACAIPAPAVKAGDPCDTTCPAPLQCSPTKHCVEQLGRPCTRNIECMTGLCEDSRCTEAKPPRNCTTDGICGADQKCVQVQPGVKRCAWNPGHPCRANGECTSQWCNRDTCSRDDGKCDSPSDCQPPFVCIGTKHKCLLTLGTQCGGDADCDSGFCNPASNRCAPSPCVPPCTGRFYCNNNVTRPACIPLILIFPREGIRFTPH